MTTFFDAIAKLDDITASIHVNIQNELAAAKQDSNILSSPQKNAETNLAVL